MGWFSGLVVFAIIWWCVFFMTLPWGIRPPDEPGEGHVPSAPARPRLWLKAGITTGIAVILWVVVYWVIASNLISFRE